MKRFFLTALILVLLFSGIAYADDVNEESTSDQWTALFTYRTSLKGAFGEIVVVKDNENRSPKVYGTNIYVQDEILQMQKKFFGAIYFSSRKPEELIKMVEKEEELLVITEVEIEEILSMIRNDDRWIILDDYKDKEESFELLKAD